MPFDRNGIWNIPTTEDHTNFNRQIMSNRQSIEPTPEMIAAIAANMPAQDSVVKPDIFKAICKLKGKADIVIPIYDGLHVLKPCIDSIIKRTDWSYKLILVDDCSPDPKIKEYLLSLEELYPNIDFKLIFNKRNRGFASTVNRGVSEGTNPYICILNSDTLVTRGWLVKQLMALEADKKNIIVNPATNNTALVNVKMYNGCSYLDMANAVSKAGNVPTYNEIMPTGFCFTTKRSLWDEIGPFDEAYTSYGEETDFWFKAIKATDEKGIVKRNRAVIADNAYIFHERGTSFSQLGDTEHMSLRRKGSERFNTLHKDFPSWQQGFNSDAAVDHLRSKLPKDAFKKIYRGNIAFVVKSAGPCGGMNFIADIVNELIEQGFNAKVCVVPDNYDLENPPTLQVVGNLRTSPILFKSHEEFTSTFTQRVFTKGKVFAAVTELTPIVWDLHQAFKNIEGYNFVQSYDPELAEISGQSELAKGFIESYKKLPNLCASNWVADKIKKDGGEVIGVVLPGVNADLFHPRNRELGDERFTIAILINKTYPFKGTDWALNFIKNLEPERHGELRILAIGPKALTGIRGVTCIGLLSQAKMATLLGTEVDILIDPSEVHSYGMPGLEALASGCCVITRDNKGIHEYETSWNNHVYIINDFNEAVSRVFEWEKDPSPRVPYLKQEAFRHIQVKKFIDLIFPMKEEFKSKRIEVITPHLRKHGGPTTIISTAKQIQALGHNVEMSTIYTDWNPEVLNMAKRINVRTKWKELPEDIELVIINSDNPFANKIMTTFPDKKYIMIKLSHNERFLKTEKDNLNLPWNHIITSTEWLRQVCLNPIGGKWEGYKAWTPEKVTTVGWYHYGHNMFNMPPTNRVYGNAKAGFRVGTLIHDHPLKGTAEAIAVIEALKKKYEANVHAAGFGECKAKLPWHMQYFKSAGRKDMAHAFKQLDVWFGASHTEGLGRLALEAMSAGALVVTTDTGAEFLKDRENCLLYPIGNAQKGGELIVEAVENEELFSKLIINGYKTAANAANPLPFRNNLNNVINMVLNKE